MWLALLLSCEPMPETPEAFGDCSAEEGDETSIEDARIESGELLLDVSYGGGCEEHDFQICWPDGSFMESDPVQVSLDLWHDAHDDGCESWLSETLTFDLAPLAEAWHDSYGDGPGQMTVHVGGLSLDYVFD